jgi:hypothetical protein
LRHFLYLSSRAALLLLISMLTVPLLAVPSHAAPFIPSLFQGSVPAADQSAATRDALLPAALTQVLDKVTGQSVWREVISSAELREWGPLLLEEYSYQTRSSADGSSPVLQLDASFSEPALKRRLAGKKIAAWSPNRPSTLLWLALETAGGREIASEGSGGETVRAVTVAASRWGVPLQLPLMDLEDRNALSPSDLWGFFTDSVQPASQRYQADMVVMAKAWQQAGYWQVQWQLRDRVRELDGGSVEQRELGAALQTMMEDLASSLAGRFAVVEGALASDQVLMEVTNLQSYEDYAACIQFLTRLAPVKNVSPQWLSGDTLRVQVGLSGTPEQFAEYISLKPVLTSSDEGTGNAVAVWRTYRWGR